MINNETCIIKTTSISLHCCQNKLIEALNETKDVYRNTYTQIAF